MIATLRQAQRGDIPAMHRVRLAVRENRLTSAITVADYIPAITTPGTRAQRFYEFAGWTYMGMLANGEALYEKGPS